MKQLMSLVKFKTRKPFKKLNRLENFLSSNKLSTSKSIKQFCTVHRQSKRQVRSKKLLAENVRVNKDRKQEAFAKVSEVKNEWLRRNLWDLIWWLIQKEMIGLNNKDRLWRRRAKTYVVGSGFHKVYEDWRLLRVSNFEFKKVFYKKKQGENVKK